MTFLLLALMPVIGTGGFLLSAVSWILGIIKLIASFF